MCKSKCCLSLCRLTFIPIPRIPTPQFQLSISKTFLLSCSKRTHTHAHTI